MPKHPNLPFRELDPKLKLIRLGLGGTRGADGFPEGMGVHMRACTKLVAAKAHSD